MKVHMARRKLTMMILLLTTVVLLEALMMIQPTDAWFDTPSGYSINSPTSTTYESMGGQSGGDSSSSSSSSDDSQSRYSIMQQLMALKKKLTAMDSSKEEFAFPGQERSSSVSSSSDYYSQQQQYTPYDYGSTGFFPLNVAGIASITESRDQTNEFLSNMQAAYRPYRTGQHEVRSATSAASDMGMNYGNQGFYPIPAEQQQQQDQGFHFPGQQQQQQQQEGFRFPGQGPSSDQLGTTGLSFNQGSQGTDDTSLFLDSMKRGYEPYRSREASQVTLSSSDWNQLSSTGFFFPSYANAQLQSSADNGDQTNAFSNIMRQNYMPYAVGTNEISSPSSVSTEFQFPGQQQQQQQLQQGQSFRFPGQQDQQQGFRYPGGLSQTTGLFASNQQLQSEGDETNLFLSTMRNNYSPYSTGANVQPSGEQQQNYYGAPGFFPANQQDQQSFKFPGQ